MKYVLLALSPSMTKPAAMISSEIHAPDPDLPLSFHRIKPMLVAPSTVDEERTLVACFMVPLVPYSSRSYTEPLPAEPYSATAPSPTASVWSSRSRSSNTHCQ